MYEDEKDEITPEEVGDVHDHELRDRRAEERPNIFSVEALNRECSRLYCRYKEHRDINTTAAMADRFRWLDAEDRLTVMQLEYFGQAAGTVPPVNATEVSHAIN